MHYKVGIRSDKKPPYQRAMKFNAPTVNEIAVFLVGQEHDIVLYRHLTPMFHVGMGWRIIILSIETCIT